MVKSSARLCTQNPFVNTPKINALLHGQGTGSKVVRVARDLKDRGDLKSIDFIQIYFFKNVLRTVSAI